MHHNYVSFYTLTAIAFLYTELMRPRDQRLFKLAAWTILGLIILLTLYIIIIASRSGMVVCFLLAAACMTHAFFWQKKRKTTLCCLALFAIGMITLYFIQPLLFNRLIDIIKVVLTGNINNDIRVAMQASAWSVISNAPWFGNGVGDYWDLLFQQYAADGNLRAFKQQYSTHNQYLETLLAVGIIGLIFQMMMMIAPVITALKKKKARLLTITITLVVAGCIFFEATFGRQMGLLFVAWWTCILILAIQTNKSPENNKA